MSFESALTRGVVLAVIAVASVPSLARTDDGRGHIATWVYDGPERYYSVSLNAAGECSIDLRDLATGRETWHYCTYWIHGSRINFREWKVRPERPEIPIQAEYIPESDLLILNGEADRPLRRAVKLGPK